MSEDSPNPVNIGGVIFDKDGTLFDFHATWSGWAGALIEELAEGDAALAQALAAALVYDLAAGRFLPGSPAIAGTGREAAQRIAEVLRDRSIDEIERHLMLTSADAPLAPAVPLEGFLAALAARGLALGVVTNDTEYGARAHLSAAGVIDRFGFVAGYDSGFGAKPAPGPLTAFARHAALAPGRVAMVGDSTHDLLAGRRAGMRTIGVLTGTAAEAELAPHADVVLPDIGHIPDWLDR